MNVTMQKDGCIFPDSRIPFDNLPLRETWQTGWVVIVLCKENYYKEIFIQQEGKNESHRFWRNMNWLISDSENLHVKVM